MALRPPPGRAGRIWLERRLDVARRGADVLDQKRRSLLALLRELEGQRAAARADWRSAALAAHQELGRALGLAGYRQVELAVLHTGEDAEAVVDWRNRLGVMVPELRSIDPGGRTDLASLGGSAAISTAASAHRHALRCAARYAAVSEAYGRVTVELGVTARRVRAIERRWVPEHEAARARLGLALEEAEREDGARARWQRARRE